MPYKFDGSTGVTGGKERQLPDFSNLMSAEERQAWMSQIYDTEIPVSLGSLPNHHPSAQRRFKGNHNGDTRQPNSHGNNNRVSKSQSIRFKSGPHAKASNVSGVEFSIEELETTDIDWRRRADKLEEENAILKTKFEKLMAELQKLRGEKAQIAEELEKMTAGYQKLQNTHTRDHYRSFDEILDLTQKLRISEQKCAILEERYDNILNGVRGY